MYIKLPTSMLGACAIGLCLILGCERNAEVQHEGVVQENLHEYRWLPASDAEKFAAIEEQLGGFSSAMTEVGYRYVELYWAGMHENWDYADYQLEHIEEAIEAGIIRRPARAASAKSFLEQDIKAMEQAIESKSKEQFETAFGRFQTACNTCHVQEEVAFIHVGIPEQRILPFGLMTPKHENND